MRVIVALALLCLLHPTDGRRINKGPDNMKGGDDLLADEDYEDEEILDDEPEVFDPNVIKEKCKGLATKEDKARCVCESAEGPGLSPEEVTARCKKLRITIFAVRASPWSCKHAPLVEGCKPFDPWRAKTNPAPEKKQSDEKKKTDDVEDDLDDLDEEEDNAGLCKEVCLPKKGAGASSCDYYPPLDWTGEDMTKFCEKQCRPQGAECEKKLADPAPNPTPERKQEDEKKKQDDHIEDELEEDEEEEVEDVTGLCARVCLPKKGQGAAGCDFYPPLSYKGKDRTPFCENDCEDAGGLCIGKSPGGGGGGAGGGGGSPKVVVEERKEDDNAFKKDDDLEDDNLDDLEDDLEEAEEEDLGESDEIQTEKEKEPTLTCASLVKSSTPGKLVTKAQLKKWCGSETCGRKLRMRTWAICGLADGRVSGPGYGGVVGDANGAFDCYINCKGEAEKISGLAQDCISSPGAWGHCSKSCGGGWQRQQLNVKVYPSGGGKGCPAPPSRGCNAHQCKDCFPADASVETISGVKAMSDLRVGDHVRSVDGSGKLTYDEVYFFGHADSTKSIEYIDLKLSGNNAALQLSPKHFLPACPKHGMRCNWADHIHIYAHKVMKGDYIWVAGADQTSLREVVERSVVVKNGLYNPYTLSGKIVVNGVVASAHSNWVLDDWTPSSMSQYLPAVYQLLFLPGRLLYQVVGTPAADFLDVNNPSIVATHGYGPEFLGMSIMVGLIVSVMAMWCTRSK